MALFTVVVDRERVVCMSFLESANGSARNDRFLTVKGMRSGYGKQEVLHGVSFDTGRGRVVAMIGPNGSGKSTVLKTVFGLVRAWEGTIEFDGKSCVGENPPALLARSLVYVSQGNRVFPDLSVHQNLTVSLHGIRKAERKKRLDEMAGLFPVVREHMRKSAGKLSGGERQQVALALALMKKPRMLLLDEPSLGLAPNLSADVFKRIKRINEEMDLTILMVEHKVREVFKIADWVLGLRRGEIVKSGEPEAFGEDQLKDLFLG